jgi:hypothetical protein
MYPRYVSPSNARSLTSRLGRRDELGVPRCVIIY